MPYALCPMPYLPVEAVAWACASFLRRVPASDLEPVAGRCQFQPALPEARQVGQVPAVQALRLGLVLE
jgi:hypothetical protein